MRATEQDSKHHNIEKMSTHEVLVGINSEDKTVALAIEKAIPQIEAAVDAIFDKMKAGGRLFYIGAGTSGRLGIVDASELPPTFGAKPDWVIGIMAGGDKAIRKAVEFAEDNTQGAWHDLQKFKLSNKDIVLGIAASGTTPYVVGGLELCRKAGVKTCCIVCNQDSPLEKQADFPIVINTGPEFITGSTRMKAGTAQKLSLNMISTAVMVKLGRVKGNKMVDMQLTNNKLVDRGVRMLMAEANIDQATAEKLLTQFGNVRKALEYLAKG